MKRTWSTMGKKRKVKKDKEHEMGQEATNDRGTMNCVKNSCEERLHSVRSCEEDQNLASIQPNKEVQGDGW